MKLTITGDKQIDRALAKLEKNIINKWLRQSMRKGLKNEMLPAVKTNYPRDTGLAASNLKIRAGKRKAGELRLKLDVSADRPNWPTYVAASGKSKGKQRIKFYPVVIEYGSKTRAPMAPIRRAYDAHGKDAIDATLRDLRDKIEKGAGK